MFKRDQYGVSHVRHRLLSPFANTLFSYLYFHLKITKNVIITSKYVKEIMVHAVFCMERNTYRFNNDILDHCQNNVADLLLCQKICSSYPNTDYFKKLYYISAFILDLVWWQYRHFPSTNLSKAHDLWITIFRNNFESLFESNGGLERFSEAAEEILDVCKMHSRDDRICSDYFLPTIFRAVTEAYGRMIPKRTNITAKEIDRLASETDRVLKVSKVGIEEVEKETEDNQQVQVEEEHTPVLPTLEESKAPTDKSSKISPEKPGKSTTRYYVRKLRKRRHDLPVEQDSSEDTDNEGTAHARKELIPLLDATGGKKLRKNLSKGTLKKSGESSSDRKTRSKRIHDSSTNDSGSESDSTSITAKTEKK